MRWKESFAICLMWLKDCVVRRHPTYETFRLQRKLEAEQREKNYLQFQLAKARADKYELEQKPSVLRDTLAEILRKPDSQLRNAARFQIRRSESGTGWEVVTVHCCLGGCDLDTYAFQEERDALLFACLLKAVGYEPPHNITCPACYAEYQKDCV